MQRRKRIDPRVIGSFVIGAVILSVAGLLFFGPGGIFSETRNYVIYFDGSVKGLNIGSPVRFRGVKIGQVKEINLNVNPNNAKFTVPVVIEIELSRIKADGGRQGLFDALKTSVQGDDPLFSMVDKGLRAQLLLDSLVTGQLYVNLDIHDSAPLILTRNHNQHPELPAIPSSLEELTKTFEDLPLKDLADKLIHSAEGFDKLINSPDLHNALTKLDTLLGNSNELLKRLDTRIAPLSDSALGTLEQARMTLEQITPLATDFHQTLNQARGIMSRLDIQIDPVVERYEQALTALTTTATEATKTIAQVENLTADDSQLVRQLSSTLHEVNQSARSLRYLATQLENDPQLLLRGHSRGDNP